MDGAAAESIFDQGFWLKKTGGTNPQTIASPAAKVRFDHIGTVPGLQAAYSGQLFTRTFFKNGIEYLFSNAQLVRRVTDEAMRCARHG